MGSGSTIRKNRQPQEINLTHATSQNSGNAGTSSGNSATQQLKIRLIELVSSVVKRSKIGDSVSIDSVTYTEVSTKNGLIGNIPTKWREIIKKRVLTTGIIVKINHEMPEVIIEVG
jgi:hypothetical protein